MSSVGTSPTSANLAQASTQSLIAVIEERLGSCGVAGSITLSISEAEFVLQILKSTPSAANLPPTTSNLDEEEEELTLEEWKAYARLGDYCGKIFNDLKYAAKLLDIVRPTDCVTLADALDAGETTNDQGKRSLQVSFLKSAAHLQKKHGLSNKVSRLAVQSYAKRNHWFHSKAGHWKASGRLTLLGQEVSTDTQALPSLLPHSMIDDVDSYRKMAEYYRDRALEGAAAGQSTVVGSVDDSKLSSLGGLTLLDGTSDIDVFDTTASTASSPLDSNPFSQGSTSPKHGASEPLDDEPPLKKVKSLKDELSGQFDDSLGIFNQNVTEYRLFNPEACLSGIAACNYSLKKAFAKSKSDAKKAAKVAAGS
ncbi:hypothetical protein VTL71DRAFT_2932 [Oculimacula yallundae]|uniref:Uncharacterized protein n=1 Tax=Oculimacula yallundae TaxID=86028 RepID=A0ABR4C5P5_9HELO